MADIIQFDTIKRRAAPTVHELITQAAEWVMHDWEKFAKLNRLNDYFTSTASVWTREGVNYLEDLNAVSVIEQKIGMNIVVRSPLISEHMGWKASFPLQSTTVYTPEMPFETYARCFNILLFIKLKRDLLAAGMADEL